MKRIILILVLVLSISMILAENSVAVTLKVKGEVEIKRDEKADDLKIGEQLYNKDLLTTGDESFAAVKFIDGSSLVKLFANSVLEINTEREGEKLGKKNKLNLGELWSKVTGKMGTYELETPSTVVSVKGTEFVVVVSEEGYTSLYTIEGKVNIRNKSDGTSEDVEAGYKAYATGTGEIEVTEYDPDELPDEDQQESNTMEIHLRNDEGEEKTIIIEVE